MEDSIDGAAVSLNVHPLKTKQREAVKAFMKGNDVFVAFPTGYGKSGMALTSHAYHIVPLHSLTSPTFHTAFRDLVPRPFSGGDGETETAENGLTTRD